MSTTIRRKRPGDASEAEWEATVRDYALVMGWWRHHTGDSRRSTPGLFDDLLIRPPRVVFLEVKVPGGRIRPAQREVLALLEKCPGVECLVVVLPDDWPRLREVLR